MSSMVPAQGPSTAPSTCRVSVVGVGGVGVSLPLVLASSCPLSQSCSFRLLAYLCFICLPVFLPPLLMVGVSLPLSRPT
jgi:hypothetical protein